MSTEQSTTSPTGPFSLQFFIDLAIERRDKLVPFTFAQTANFLVLHPQAALRVLTDTRHFSREGVPLYTFAQQLFGNGLITSSGELHRRQRRLMQPLFHRKYLLRFNESMCQAINILLARWTQLAPGPVLLQEEMFAVALHIIGEVVCSSDLTEQTHPIAAFFGTLVRAMSAQASQEELQQATRQFYQAMNALIQQRRLHPGVSGDLLDLLIGAHDPQSGATLSEQQIADEVVTLITGGHATTQLALTWLWYEVCRHPRVEAMLYEEIDRLLAGRPPTLADVANLSYTRQVVAETLRLYPPDTLLIRRVAEGDRQVGDTLLPEGSFVHIVPWLLQRDPRWWSAPSPEQFIPERWQQDIPHIPGAYLPFSTGSHICIGQPLAELEMALVVATIAQRFRLRLPQDFPPVEPHLVAVNLYPHPTPQVLLCPRE